MILFFVLALFGIFVLSVVCVIAVLVVSFRKSIIVFYDLSDALLSSIVYIASSVGMMYVYQNLFFRIIGYAEPQITLLNGLFKSYAIPITALFVFISVVMIFYSFFAAYHYNKPRKFAIFLSFIGRYFLVSFLLNLPLLLFSIMKYAFGSVGLYYSLLIILEAFIVLVIFVLISRFLVYKTSMSDMSYFVDFKRMEALGKEFTETQKAKREERLRMIQERRTAAMNRPR